MPFVSSIDRDIVSYDQDIHEVKIVSSLYVSNQANSKRVEWNLNLPEATWRQTRSISSCNYFNIIFSLTMITYYYEVTIAFLIGRKRTVNFRNQHLWRHIAADFTIIMSRTLKVTDNHVMYDRSAWFVRVMMPSSRALCCLPSVKKQKHEFNFFFRSIYNKTIIRFGFCDIQNNQGIIFRNKTTFITPTSTLITVDIKKTSSNNC